MQEEILETFPEDELSVFAIWLPMLAGDRRSAWDPDLMPDPRVRHYWDENRVLGRYFADKGASFGGVAWDIYFLYGPDASWTDVPEPLISSGFTVIGSKDRLLIDIVPLLED